MQTITRLSVTRAWATAAIFLALSVAGFVAFRTLPVDRFPSVKIPVVTIMTIYPGANPREIETQITQPVEDAIAGLSDLDFISSTSGDGFSSVVVSFTDKADDSKIASDVERRVNSITSKFPSGVRTPTVQKIDLSAVPVMQLAVVDDVLTAQELSKIVDDVLLPSIEQISGVSQVVVVGARKEEVQIEVDPVRLAAYGISLQQMQGALAASNASIPGGRVTQGPRQFDLQVNGRVTRPEELGDVVIGGSATGQVRVRDVARVIAGATEQTQMTRVNGKQALLVAVAQQSGSNLTDVTDAVRKDLPNLEQQLPASSQLKVVQDATPFVRNSLDGIEHELVIAVVLTSVILLLFLHNIRAALIVLLSIPTTLLTTFILMQLMGFSLNFLSMLGLTLTIGILVDDSIVVLENILRHLSNREPPFMAALNGRAEIGLAAVAITLVDVVVFAPTGLVSGQVGGFFREFGFTIAAATLMSLVVSFTLTPLLAARFLKPENEHGTGIIDRFGRWWDLRFGALEQRYRAILDWSLSHRLIVSAVAAASLFAGIWLVTSGLVPAEFIPKSDDGYFTVATEAPPGTSLAAHDAIMRQVEARIMAMPEVETVTASIGVGQTGFFGGSSVGQGRYGNITGQVHHISTGRRDIYTIIDDMRARLADVPGVNISVTASIGSGNGQPVALRIKGDELDGLVQVATQVQMELERTPGIINITNGAPTGQPQLLIDVDPLRAANYGVNSSTVGLLVRTAFAGVEVTKFQEPDGTQQDVLLRFAPESRTDLARVGDLPIPTAGGQTVALRQVATLREVSGPTQINRRDRERVVVVGADLATGHSLSEVQPALNRIVQETKLPNGYSIEIGGESADQAESFGQLFLALGASVLMAYLLMAVLYNSLLDPLVILFSLPVAVGGAMFGLFAFGYVFSVFSMIGLILLVGLAIKNGILLVDRTNQNRERGMNTHDALLEAGPARLRPILMTSLTIAIALTPTALQLGEGAEMRAPLAATVLGGVISSTMLTLVLIPVVYTLIESAMHFVHRVLRLVHLERSHAAVPIAGGADNE
ncbi:MAG: efflux RND transporter permease subunit [Dehalococcoidia bacterium]